MKKWLVLPILALFACLLLLPASAEVFEEQAAAFGVSDVEGAAPEAAQELLDGAGVTEALEPESLFSRLAEAARDKLGDILRRGAASAAALVAVALLCGLVAVMAEGETPQYVTLGGVLAVAVIAAGDADAFITKGQEALQTLSDFSQALLPCLCTAAAAGGAVTSAAAKYAATALFMDIFITAAKNVALPFIYGYMAAAVAAAALDNPVLESAASLARWVCGAAITLIMSAFTLYLTVSGAVTGAADALAVKAAKTAMSAALPVVGGILSDAAGTVVSGAGLLRGAVGAFGMFVVAAVCLTPFLVLGVQYLMYKAAAVLAGAFADKRLAGLIGAVGSAFGMVLGLVGAGALMLFFSIISMVKAVTP